MNFKVEENVLLYNIKIFLYQCLHKIQFYIYTVYIYNYIYNYIIQFIYIFYIYNYIYNSYIIIRIQLYTHTRTHTKVPKAHVSRNAATY